MIALHTYELIDIDTLDRLNELVNKYVGHDPILKINGDTIDRVRSVSVIIDNEVVETVQIKLNRDVPYHQFC